MNINEIVKSKNVAVSTGNTEYPVQSPYSPNTKFPEYPFNHATFSHESNHAYEGVRDAFRLLEFDAENYNNRNWNPLGGIIKTGDTVVLKPNFVRDFRETFSGHEDCLITHGSIIRAVMDYVYIALQGKGRIIIADAPQNDADFDAIRKIAGLDEIKKFYKDQAGLEIEIYDLRPECAKKVDGVIIGHENLAGDPSGYVKVNLGKNSMFTEIDNLCNLLYGSEYDTSEIRSHHTGGVHEYLISKTILGADCVINLPKLKTHKKTGLTVCMKNLVGINGNKNWLPHHREGTPSQGGDQFADDSMKHKIERKTMALFRKTFPKLGVLKKVLAKPAKSFGTAIFGDTNTDTIRSGNWYGNDTTWRMAIDLNKILFYADINGNIQDKPARKIFCIVDGIVAGEGNGPLDPTPKPTGVFVAGANPVAVDLVCAMLMGFDYKKIPILYRALFHESLPLYIGKYEDIKCISNYSEYNKALCDFNEKCLAFKPHFGWLRHIEIAK